MSENRHPNKKRRATSPDEQVKRIRLPRSSVAASAGSIAATSANASHGSTNRVSSNKRAREEQSTVPSSIIKRARANPATLPLALPFTLAPPVPKPTKKKKLSADEVKIFGHLPLRKQLLEAAAALIALAQQVQDINKPPAVFIDLPGGKRRRILSQAISSSNNNNGRPRPNSNRRIIIDAPIFGRRSAPTTAPTTAPAPTEATAATSTATATATATAGNQAASNDYYISSSDESSVSSDDKSLSGMALLSGMPGASSPGQQSACSTSSWDDNYSHPDVDMPDINTDDETSLAGINLLPAIDEGKSVIKIQANFRGFIVRNLKPRAAPQAEFDANDGGGQEQECDGNLNDVSSLSEDEEWSGEEDDNAMIQSVLKVAPASTGDDNDEVNEESSNTEDSGASVQTEEVHFEADNAADEDGHEDDVVSTTEEDANPSISEDDGVHFDVADNAVDEDGEEEDEESSTVNSQARFEFDPAAMDTPEMDVDNDGQDSFNLDAASNAGESNNIEASVEEEEDAMDEEEEVEVVQPAPRKRPRMLAELQSSLDGWYWRQATTRRFIDRN